jgi:hypothetical protein
MKYIATLLVIACAGIVAYAQEPRSEHTPPNVEILSQKWSKVAVVQVTDRPDYDVIPAPGRSSPPPRIRTLQATRYVYEARVRNTGDQDIRAMRWDYVFVDPDTQEEIERRRFYSTVTIHPNHEKTLEGYTRSAPSAIVSARALPAERVVIECITLSDGTTWRLPSYKGKCSPDKSPKPPPQSTQPKD